MCMTPLKVKNKGSDLSGFAFNVVPCGKCPKCLQQRVNSWAFRLEQEEKIHYSASFVTLTYDNENIPLTDKNLMTLDKVHVQNFLKYIRRNTKRRSIKYYAVGEYGTRTKRPHYHLIIFDVTEQECNEAWTKGNVHFAECNKATVRYTLKYVNKVFASKIPLGDWDDRIAEFSLMSKKMGLNYLTPSVVKHHKEHKKFYLDVNGNKQKLPRYYKEKIFTKEEIKVNTIEVQKKEKQKFLENVKKFGDEKTFYREQFYSIAQYFENYKKTLKNERNGI